MYHPETATTALNRKDEHPLLTPISLNYSPQPSPTPSRQSSVDPDPSIPDKSSSPSTDPPLKQKQVCAPPLPRSTVMSKLLKHPPPKTKIPIMDRKCARVLTSAENLEKLAEKERKKREESEMKEKCKQEREARRKEKENACKLNKLYKGFNSIHAE